MRRVVVFSMMWRSNTDIAAMHIPFPTRKYACIISSLDFSASTPSKIAKQPTAADAVVAISIF